eukprot:TRINITY_DN8561_c3_g2_i1.p1 TRINITY_DN8561_c3_g2~~TRINITY_DN8561_c3_g2_i1.p1  ORF type:complete len:880 (+),score=181.10 TRINITY_DN8561_c3_g2_i1:101-2740(+)
MIADGLISTSSTSNASQHEGAADFAYSHDLDIPFRVKVDNLEGCMLGDANGDLSTDIYVMLELCSNGVLLCPGAYSAKCKSRCRHTNAFKWHDVVVFPMSYRDLPLDTLLLCTVWSSAYSHPVGGSSTYVFSTVGQLKRGSRRLALHESVQADGSEPSETLGRITDTSFMARTNKATLRFTLRQMKHVLWLDRLTFQEINNMKKTMIHQESTPVLVMEFPIFPVPIYHQSLTGPIPQGYTAIPSSGLVTVRDPEIDVADNPCEVEAARIMKSQHLVVDPDLKPNAAQYTEIQSILKHSALMSPTPKDTHLLWQFRYFLQKNKIGFTKFMRCVDWTDPKEEAIATGLIPKWGGLIVEDCLEILGASFKGISAVRSHAVQRLDKENNDFLKSILLQLVQAFRYEADPLSSPLLDLLLQRASASWDLCSYLYWYLHVETEDPVPDTAAIFKTVEAQLLKVIKAEPNSFFYARLAKQTEFMTVLANIQEKSASVRQKMMKSTAMQTIKDGHGGITQLFWKKNASRHLDASAKETKTGLSSMVGIGKSLKASMANLGYTKQQEDPKEDSVNPEEETAETAKITPPILPDIDLTGIRDDDVHFYKSAKRPMALTFLRPAGHPNCRLMYKAGDDIRQDQLVQQIVGLIDKLLKQDGLDLMLTPYKCLATSVSEGMVEIVPNVVPLQDIIDGNNIQSHLRKYNYDEKGDFQLTKECLDTWVKSNAGYAIITFVLGIGDRHLENLLVTNDGRMVHIDFGFILGRDPKPFPPPLKLRKEMVDAMGGTESARFNEFKKLCCGSFNIIRKHAALIINSMAMMVDANIPDLTSDVRTTKNAYSKIQSVEDKMRLDLNDAEATNYFLDILNEALNSIMGKIGDWAHIKAGKFK